MSEDPTLLAQRFLTEAVYRSRSKQAVQAGLAGADPDRPSDAGNCGLGQEAAFELDLGPEGAELARGLWPDGLAGDEARRVDAALRAWVARQDALDRKRNHFLRDFRAEHGADRRRYPQDVARRFEAGLERINGEVRDALADAARALLG